MTRYHIIKDSEIVASTATREEAIEMIRLYQARETHYLLKASFSIIKGNQEFIPYSDPVQPKKGDRTITPETLEKIGEHNFRLEGTSEWFAQHCAMECYSKDNKGRYVFLGWGNPSDNMSATLRIIKGQKYLYQKNERYTVNDKAAHIMGI